MTGTKKTQVTERSLAVNYDLPIMQKGDLFLIDANLLHKKLKVETRFNDWIKRRISEFGFEPEKDFYSNLSNGKGTNRIEVHLTLDMAKELAMLERNDVGRSIRRYFIQKEKESKKALPAIRTTGSYSVKPKPEAEKPKLLGGQAHKNKPIHNRLSPTRLNAILADVCMIEDNQLRMSLVAKLKGGSHGNIR